MNNLNHLLDQLERNIEYHNAINANVSQRDVSWHMAHSLKVLAKVIEAVKNSNPEAYQWKFNFYRSLTYTLGFFPRGKGRAPKSVLPEDNISKTMLLDEFNTVRKLILELETQEAKSNFMHPYFGQLNLKQTKKFLALHTKHHLKIIEDILKG